MNIDDKLKHQIQGLSSAALLLRTVIEDLTVDAESSALVAVKQFARLHCSDPVKALWFAEWSIRDRMRGLAKGNYEFNGQKGSRPGQIKRAAPKETES